jgi:hypothetical protein
VALGVCFGVVVTLALVRMLTAHEGMPYWGHDPFVFGAPITGVTDGWGIALGSVTVVLSGAVVWIARKGGGVGVVEGVCLAMGMGACGWHVWTGEGAVTRTMALGVFVCVLVATRCACRAVPALRGIALAVVLGSVAVLLIEGAHQVLVQHPMTVEYFERSKDEFLASRGWREGSYEALSYERRLRQPELSAWFGLSNVYAGLVGAMALGLALVAVVGRGRWARLAAVLGAVGGGAALAVSGSKGAIGAVVLGVLVVVFVSRTTLGARVGAGKVTIGACAAMIGGTVLGGLMGQLSLLFRSQYLVGSLRIAREYPVVGVGSEGFQGAYMVHKPATGPEDVASAHDVVLDLIAMLGVGGLALVVLLAAWVWRVRVDASEDGGADRAIPARVGVRVIAGVVLVSAVAMIRVGAAALDVGHLALLGVGAAAWIGVGVALWRSMGDRAAALGALGAMVVLGLHGLFDLGAVWVVSAPVWGLGIGMGVSLGAARVGAAGSGIAALAMVALGGIGVWRGVERVGVDGRLIELGDRAIGFAEVRDRAMTSVDRSEQAAIARAMSEMSGARVEVVDRASVEDAERRVRAGLAESLAVLGEESGDPDILIAAVEQGLAALGGEGADAVWSAGLWDRLFEIAGVLEGEGAPFRALRWSGRIHEVRARGASDPGDRRAGLERALAIWARADGLNPHDPGHALRMMDLCVELGMEAEGGSWAREAIDRSDQMALDPLRGLGTEELERARGVLGG